MVVFTHFWMRQLWGGVTLDPLSNVLFRASAHGVDLFFVLSGFLIGGILMDHVRSPRLFRVFYLRRAFRILPAYWLLLLAFALVRQVDARLRFGLLAYLYDPNPLPALRYLLFVQNFVMASEKSIDPVWLVVTWSLAIEEQFYLVIPWLIRFFSRYLVPFCIAGILGSLVLRFFYISQPAANIFAAENLLVCRADALCVGIIVAMLSRSVPARRWLATHASWLRAGFAAAILAYVVPPFANSGNFTDVIYQPTLYALADGLILLQILETPAGVPARLLRAGALVWLGGISYFVYLFHLPFQFTAVTLVRRYSEGHDGLATAASVGAAFLVACGSRRWFEQPLIRFSHRFSYD